MTKLVATQYQHWHEPDRAKKHCCNDFYVAIMDNYITWDISTATFGIQRHTGSRVPIGFCPFCAAPIEIEKVSA